MIPFAVAFITFLILIRIPVVKEITFVIIFVGIVAFLIALGFAYSDAKHERELREGIRR